MLSPHGFIQTDYQTQAAPAPQLQPHDIVAEEALLGALLLDPAQMIEVGYLESEDFFLFNNGRLFGVMKTLFEKQGDYDPITVIDKMGSLGHLEDWAGGADIYALIDRTPTSYGAPHYAVIIYRHSVERQLLNRCTGIVQDVYQNQGRPPDDLVSDALRDIAEIDATRNITAGAKPVKSAVARLMNHIDSIQAGEETGLKTGIVDLDKVFGGFVAKNIYILAGRPGMGKTGLALQFAHNLALRGKRILFFSLEMAEERLAARLVSQTCKIPYKTINSGQVEDWESVFRAMAEVERLPVIIDDTPAMTISAIRSVAQKEAIKAPLDLIIIDHAGIARSTAKGGRYEQQCQIADDVMALPKQVGCPVLALLQLSRSIEGRNRNDRRPVMSDLRDSGKWEENADGIMFLYRDEVYNPDTEYPHLAEIIIAKNRDGETGFVNVYHQKQTSVFADLKSERIGL